MIFGNALRQKSLTPTGGRAQRMERSYGQRVGRAIGPYADTSGRHGVDDGRDARAAGISRDNSLAPLHSEPLNFGLRQSLATGQDLADAVGVLHNLQLPRA